MPEAREAVAGEAPAVPPPANPCFDRLMAAFARACRRTGTVERLSRIGGTLIRQRFAGPALEHAMTRALAARPLPTDGPADLTVCFWDARSTGVSLPPLDLWNTLPGADMVQGAVSGRYLVHRATWNGAFQMLDRSGGRAVYCVPDAAAVPDWEASFPMRKLLHGWFADASVQPVHAAAVGRPEGGVLLAGGSGSGKTTTALACLEGGLGYAGDDYVLLHLDPSARVEALYTTAKLTADALTRLPRLAGHVANADRLGAEKALIHVDRIAPERMVEGFPVAAVVLPRVCAGQPTRLRPATAAEAWLALAPTTVLQLKGAGPQVSAKLSRFVRSTPAYRLDLGPDLSLVAPLIDRLLRGGVL